MEFAIFSSIYIYILLDKNNSDLLKNILPFEITISLMTTLVNKNLSR